MPVFETIARVVSFVLLLCFTLLSCIQFAVWWNDVRDYGYDWGYKIGTTVVMLFFQTILAALCYAAYVGMTGSYR